MTGESIKKQVIIIGAGLTGLTLAYYLMKQGLSFIIIEEKPSAGGVIHTYKEKGFVFEAGPNTGVLANNEIIRLFRDLNGSCQLEKADSQAKRRLIWKDDCWHSLPGGMREAISTKLFTWHDKFRILGEPFRPRGKDPLESVAGMVKRRMGQSFLDYAVDPFISGIYAGDPDTLITQFALPKLFELEQNYGSFIKGAVRKKMQNSGPTPSKEVFSVKGGLENLVKALVKKTGEENIIFNASHSRVAVAPGGYRLITQQGDQELRIDAPVVIPTVGAHSLTGLFPFFPIGLLENVTKLNYAKVVQVVLGFDQWKGCNIKAFGGLVPSREKRKILGVLFTSSFLSQRAPEGGALLNVFLGGARHPEFFDLPDEKILDMVEKEIKCMMDLREYDPQLVKIFRYSHAIPQYGKESDVRIKAIEELQEKYKGIILAGNIHEGIGMAHRVAQAVKISDLVAKEFSEIQMQNKEAEIFFQ